MSENLLPELRAVLDRMQQYPHRFTVRVIVATTAGARRSHHQLEVNAADQLAAIPVALFKLCDDVKLDKWDELHVLVDPLPPRI